MKHSTSSTTQQQDGTTATAGGGGEAAAVIMLEKLSPAGGDGGNEFDSGCNLSGIKRISIECGPYTHHFQHYKSTIKRVYVEFNNNRSEPDALYFGIPMDTVGNKTFSLDVDSATNDIVKVTVWANDKLANAIQFHFASGEVSPRYGIPSSTAEPTTYCWNGEGSKIVSIYGRVGKVTDAIGFAFSKPASYDWEKIPCSVGGGGGETPTDIDSIVTPSVKGEELASIVSSLRWED